MRTPWTVGLLIFLLGACEQPPDELAVQLSRSDPRLARILEGAHPRLDAERVTLSTGDFRVQLPRAGIDALTVRRGTHVVSLRATSAEGVFAESAGRLTLRRAREESDFVISSWCADQRAPCAVEGVEWALVVREPRPFLRETWKLSLGELTPRMTSQQGDVLFVDSSGTPQFRIPRPYAVDSAGERREGFVAADGDSLIVQVDTHDLKFPIVVDPSIENAVWFNPLPIAPDGIAFDDTQRGHVLVLATDGSTWEWNSPHWSRLPATPPVTTTNTQPTAFRSLFGVVWDSGRSRAVAFGSLRPQRPGNDTWEWTGTDWVTASPAVRPSARAGMAMAYDATRGETVLFGGADPDPSDQTWTWNGVNWTLRTPAMKPAPRFDVRMAFDATRSRMVLHGGAVWNGMTYVWSGETWEWDGANWTLAGTGPVLQGLMVFDPSEAAVVLLGINGETRRWDGTTWSPITTLNQRALTVGAAPPMQPFAAFDSSRQRLVVGAASTWEVSSRRWEQVPLRPPPRFMHGSAWDPVNRATLIFGGMGAPSGSSNFAGLDDTWLWDGSRWAQKQPAFAPSERTRPGVATDFRRKRIVLFGGQNMNGGHLGDTWEWDGVSWTRMTPAVQPSARVAPALGWDDQHQEVVLFGGGGVNGLLNDTWTWNGTSWTQKSPVHVPPERFGAGLGWSESEQLLVMAGGGPVGDAWTWNGQDWTQTTGNFGASAFTGLASSDRGPIGYVGATVEYVDGGWISQTSNEPTPRRFGAALVADPLRHRVVLAGGQLNLQWMVLTDEVWEHVTRGRTCTTADECGTGFCVDGVCCDSACGNGNLFDCLACSRERGATADGICGPVMCRAASPCLTAMCDVSTGACVSAHVPDGGSCDDSRECTQGDVCVAGVCLGTPADGGRCQNDRACGWGICSSGACIEDPVRPFPAGFPCDDGNSCSNQDRCSDAGVCLGTAIADGTGCDDQQLCTDADSCQAGRCTGGPAHVCSPGTCAAGSCSTQDGHCSYGPLADGSSCTDNDACTTTETCLAGACTGAPVQCPPANECSTGICSSASGCGFAAVVDGLPCDGGGTCQSGACQAAQLDAGSDDAGSDDAGSGDAGSADAGTSRDGESSGDAGVGEQPRQTGCQCATIDPSLLAGLILIAARKRRTRR